LRTNRVQDVENSFLKIPCAVSGRR
jgi:hypothetical protein